MATEELSLSGGRIVSLNVGGRRFMTTTLTLMRASECFLASPPIVEGYNAEMPFFIDRNPDVFSYVLDSFVM